MPIQHVEFGPSKVMVTPDLSTGRQPTVSPQIQLVQLCVARGFLLRICGFDRVDGGSKFRCSFEVTVGKGEKIIGQSQYAHSSIREAQIDAASVTLSLLPEV
jgi:hypothetical protein